MSYLAKVPGYGDAGTLADIQADALTPEAFHRDFVDRRRPCVVRNAVRHWPAFERWQDLRYVASKVGNPTVDVNIAPLVEPFGAPENQGRLIKKPFHAVLDELEGEGERLYRVVHYHLSGDSPWAALGEDVGGFRFLPDRPPPRFYVPARGFLYGDSYTDFHPHPTDETFMCQIRGDKEVLLLPPDDHHWNALTSVYWANDKALWDVDVEAFPQWKSLRPLRALVRPGDALYIPPWWQHAVENVGGDFGWTVAWCWASPPGTFDLRLPGVRFLLKSRHHMLTRNGPRMAAAAVKYLLSFRRHRMPPYAT